MELIIKPTGRCNFACKFCSAHGLDVAHPKDGKVPEILKEYINKHKIEKIIVTGGEPLMMDPDYYYELYSLPSVMNISITTNLKDFYLNPDKWVDLFNKEWFGITTSFNYGNTRMWDKDTVYTEEMFIKVINKFKEYIPGRPVPSFIAVIDESNEDTILDHVYLAKRLNTMVKLNAAVKSGRQSKSYPRYKIIKAYNKIIDLGLEDYECNCSTRKLNKCPQNIGFKCLTMIRCCYIDKNGQMHFSTCDEQISLGHEFSENEIPVITENDFIKEECSYCDLFWFCNGCNNFREDSKKFPEHCEEMKKMLPDLIRNGWLFNNDLKCDPYNNL